MVSVEICEFIKNNRRKFDAIDVSLKVEEFKEKICHHFTIVPENFDLIYHGFCLENSTPLINCGVKDGATLYLVQKVKNDDLVVVMDESIEVSVLSAIKSTLSKSSNRYVIQKILKTAEDYRKIIEAAPGIQFDPIALGLLRDPSLLAKVISQPGHLSRILKKHPSLGHACLTLASEVSKARSLLINSGVHTADEGSYSLDQLSDEDSDDTAASSNQEGAREASGHVTSSQLMAALSSIGSSRATSELPTMSQGGRVTSDFFQNAFRQAQASTSGSSVSNNPQLLAVGNMESNLAQLRDMGITDEAVARQALIAANGDLQAALEFIFAERDDLP